MDTYWNPIIIEMLSKKHKVCFQTKNMLKSMWLLEMLFVPPKCVFWHSMCFWMCIDWSFKHTCQNNKLSKKQIRREKRRDICVKALLCDAKEEKNGHSSESQSADMSTLISRGRGRGSVYLWVCARVWGKMPRKIYMSSSQAPYFLSLLQRMTHAEESDTDKWDQQRTA